MGLTWHASTTIPAPIEAVWAVLADPARDPEWRGPWVTEVVQLNDGPLAVETRFETRYSGGRGASRSEITECEPPNRLGWRQVGSGGGMAGTVGHYVLAPDGAGTRVSVEIRGELAGPPRLVGRIATWVTNRFVLPGQLRRLREVVVRGGGPPADAGPAEGAGRSD